MPMILKGVLELLGASDLPDSPQELEELRQWISQLAEEKGLERVREQRYLIADQWEALQGRPLIRG